MNMKTTKPTNQTNKVDVTFDLRAELAHAPEP